MPRKKTTKSTAKKTNAKSAKKLDNLEQTHGKDESVKYEARTLDQVWGDDGLWRYSTLDEDVYGQQVKDMTRSDMYAHASRIGIIPTENLDLLRNRLFKEFRRHVSLYTVPVDEPQPKKVSSDVRKILDEGK